MGNEDKEFTLEDEIEELLGDIPEAVEEEEQEQEQEQELDQEDAVDEVDAPDKVDDAEEEGIEEVIEDDEGKEEPEVDEVAEAKEDEDEEDEEEIEEGPKDDISDFRSHVNKIAKATLEQGVSLPPDLLGIEDDPKSDKVDETQSVTPAPIKSQESLPAQYSDFQILTEGVDFNSFLDNEESFVGGMRDILSRHEQMLAQKFMSLLPGIVQNQTQQILTLQKASDRFYQDNDDLEPVRATVGAVANEIANRNPGWDLPKVLEESAKTTRKILKMPVPAGKKKGKKKSVNPSFASTRKTSQRGVKKVKMTKLQQEIDDIL